MINLPDSSYRKPPFLKEFENPLQQLKAIYEYSKIDLIYCDCQNPKDYAIPHPVSRLSVNEIGVPPGTPSFIKSKLKEYNELLIDHIRTYLDGNETFEIIESHLMECIQLCRIGTKENNHLDSYRFNEEITFLIKIDQVFHQVPYNFMALSSKALDDFYEHLNIRKYFYASLEQDFEKALNLHLKAPNAFQTPYKWDSPKAQLEISELLYILCKKAEIIKIDKKVDGSFSKFRKAFFGLFGLKDERYDQNISDILSRKKGDHFIKQLYEIMSKAAPETSKNIP